MVRRTATFAELSDELLHNTLEMLSGRYPSEEFSELRPRLVWDRVNDTRARPRRVEAPRRHVGRHDPRPRPVRGVPARRQAGRRARRGDGLREPSRRDCSCSVRRRGGSRTSRSSGSPSRRRRASPARCRSGTATGPAARSSSAGRSARSCASCGRSRLARRSKRLRDDHALDELAANNLLQYVTEQAEATGVVPDDRTIVVERFRDEIGDWRVCVLSPFGTPVHAPWAMAIERRLADRFDIPVESMWGDDGIVLRLPESADDMPLDAIQIDPEDIEELVVSTLPQTALFSSRFRECAGAIAAAAAPPTRPAHAAVAAAPARRRPARGRRQAPDVPRAAGGVARVPAGRVRRPGAARGARAAAVAGGAGRQRRDPEAVADGAEPAVQLDRRLHVRGRRPAGRATGRGAGARPRPARRPARRRGAARAARPGRARRRRARPAAPVRRAARPHGRRAARRAAAGRRPVDHRGRAAVRAGRRADRLASDARHARRRAASDRDRHRAASSGSPPPTTPPGTATALGCSLPLGLPAGVHRARAAAARRPRRPLRPHPRSVRRARRRGAVRICRSREPSARSPRSRPTSASCAASSVPTACVASGATSTCSASCGGARWRCCARRSSRSSRPCCAEFLPAWQGVGQPAQGARSARRGARRARRRADRGVDARARRARGPGQRVPPDAARRAVHVGRGGVDRRRRDRVQRRAGPALLRRPGRAARAGVGRGRPTRRARSTTRCATRSKAGGASFWSQLRAGVVGPTDDELLAALWDLVWAGEVTNDSMAALRAMTTGGGHARRAGEAGRHVAAATAAGRRGSAASVRPTGAGRWSLVAQLLEPRPTSTAAAHAAAMQLVERHGRASPARACSPRASSAGSRRSTRCSRCSRSAARSAAATSSAASAPPSSPCRGPSIGCARCAAPTTWRPEPGQPLVLVGHRSGPAVRRRAGVARLARPPGPHRRAVVVMREGVPLVWHDRRSHHLVTFTGRHDRLELGRRAAVDWCVTARCGPSRSARSTARRWSSRPTRVGPPAAVDAGFTDSYRGLAFRRS